MARVKNDINAMAGFDTNQNKIKKTLRRAKTGNKTPKMDTGQNALGST